MVHLQHSIYLSSVPCGSLMREQCFCHGQVSQAAHKPADLLLTLYAGHNKGDARTVQHNVFLTEFKDAQMQKPCIGIASVTITSASSAAIEIRCVLPSFEASFLYNLYCSEADSMKV